MNDKQKRALAQMAESRDRISAALSKVIEIYADPVSSTNQKFVAAEAHLLAAKAALSDFEQAERRAS